MQKSILHTIVKDYGRIKIKQHLSIVIPSLLSRFAKVILLFTIELLNFHTNIHKKVVTSLG